MSIIQLNFTLRISSKCKQVHLVGSWDTYKSHLPLVKDASTSKSGGWRGTFRFASPNLIAGQRYWYYYIIDGYHVSHDPARDYTTEPTTGRKLNILDIPLPKGSSSLPIVPGTYSTAHSKIVANSTGAAKYATLDSTAKSKSSKHSSPTAKGRGLSPSQIRHPYPSRPYETQAFRSVEMEALSRRYALQRLTDLSSDSSSDAGSDSSTDSSAIKSSPSSLPSLSSRSSHNSSPSSISSVGSCSCERFARLKDGSLVRIDCGGSVCASAGSSDSSSGDDERSRSRKIKKGSSKKGAKHSGNSRKVRSRR